MKEHSPWALSGGLQVNNMVDNIINLQTKLPPDIVRINFAAEVIKRNCQLILLLQESITAYTAASIIEDESYNTLRDSPV